MEGAPGCGLYGWAIVIDVKPIAPWIAMPWILERHYAKRSCPITYAFGGFVGVNLVGVITYGTPASSPLRSGICGKQYENCVLELNRLCCESKKNYASQLIGKSLSMLPRPSVIVSYADTKHGHVGYVYQATNWIYTGLSAKRTDWKVRWLEHLHGATIADMSRGVEKRADFMREKFGDDFYLENRSRKHHYVFFCGNKFQRKNMKTSLMYPICDYPKGESNRYEANENHASQMRLLLCDS